MEATEFPDTGTYEHVANAPLFSAEFLTGWRPPTLPLLYKVLTTDGPRVAGQLALSIACWLALAGVVASTLADRRMRVLGFAAILVFSLSPDVLRWDPLLLSESVAVSMTAGLVATWLLLLRDPTGLRVALMLATAAAWALTRDLNSYLLLLAAVAAIAWLLAGRDRRVPAVAVAGLLIISVAGILSARIGFERWQGPFQNVLALRVAADQDKLAYFEDAGMPVTPRFLELSRQYRKTGDNPFLPPTESNPERRDKLLPFQHWIGEEGEATYTRYLLTQPQFVAEAFGELNRMLLFPRLDDYASAHEPWRIPLLPELVYPRNGWLPLLYLAIAVGLAIAALGRPGPRGLLAVPGFMIAASLPFAVLAFHGDALDLDRHGLLASLFLRLGTLLLLLIAADRLLSARRQPADVAAARGATG